MRIYIAGAYAARDILREEARFFEEHGHTVTSSWLKGARPLTSATLGTSPSSSQAEVEKHVKGDLEDIASADALVIYTGAALLRLGVDPGAPLHTGGRHVEMGVALAHQKGVVVVGEMENVFQRALARHAHHTFDALALLASIELQQNLK